MAESEISYFEFLKNFIDIRRMAFSTRGTRLVIMQNDEGVLIRQSERPGKAMTERGGSSNQNAAVGRSVIHRWKR